MVIMLKKKTTNSMVNDGQFWDSTLTYSDLFVIILLDILIPICRVEVTGFGGSLWGPF